MIGKYSLHKTMFLCTTVSQKKKKKRDIIGLHKPVCYASFSDVRDN